VLFGGTFDPIHNAHLEIARTAADRFNFEKILFVPAANPPHKTNRAQAPYEDRIRMAQLACECDRRFEVSRIEEGSERSYSITTIEKLKECGIAPIGFLIGADAFAEIESWHRWKDVVHSVEFIVVTRPGAVYKLPEGATVYELQGLNIAVSSSDVRARLLRGDFDVPVPPVVLAYIRDRRIYQSQKSQKK